LNKKSYRGFPSSLALTVLELRGKGMRGEGFGVRIKELRGKGQGLKG
jgi:hypothetical protein